MLFSLFCPPRKVAGKAVGSEKLRKKIELRGKKGKNRLAARQNGIN